MDNVKLKKIVMSTLAEGKLVKNGVDTLLQQIQTNNKVDVSLLNFVCKNIFKVGFVMSKKNIVDYAYAVNMFFRDNKQLEKLRNNFLEMAYDFDAINYDTYYNLKYSYLSCD